MKTHFTITVLTILLATLASSVASSQGTREVRLGNDLLLRVRCAAGGYTIDERTDALQLRANNLLKADKQYSTFTVRKAGGDSNIYADDTFFMTVTPADAKANGTTSAKLANSWAERLRVIFPRSTPDKPGVGRPDQPDVSGSVQ
jgi:hypothetical protein